MTLFKNNYLHIIIYYIISIIIIIRLLTPIYSYILTLDGTITPYNYDPSFAQAPLYGLTSYVPYLETWLPVYIFIKFLGMIFHLGIVQKFIFFLTIFLSGISMHSLINTKSSIPKYFAGILYAVNPFVYVRFLAGHWLILLAYSIIPFAVKSFLDFLDNQSKKNLVKSVLLTTLVGAVNSHILVLTFLVYSILVIFKLYQIKNEASIKNLLRSLIIFAGLFLLLSLYWLLPVLTAKSTLINQISQADIYAFATKTSAFNAAFTIASMYGFWRWGYIYAKDLIPYWYFLFVFILFLAIHGFINNYKSKTIGLPVKALAVVAVIAVILGSGIYGPFSSLFDYLFNNIFFFKGLRDSHKFAALLALSYSYLGALGVAEFEKIARTQGTAQDGYAKYKKLAAWTIVIAALITPFIYSFTMFNGFWGQLKPVDYPEDWYETNDLLNNDPQDFNVLFLPWHQYMDFKWIPNAQKRIANPASSFFDKPIIQGENTEIGSIYSQSTNPAQRYVESLLIKRNNLTNFGELIIPLNVKYMLLTKEVDYKEYFFLFNQTDVELIQETKNFYIFKNKHVVSRFYQSPSPEPQFLSLSSLPYTQASPVKFSVKTEAEYIVFVPPNLDSEHWELEGKPSLAHGFYAVYPASEGTVYYRRFDTYLVGYVVSLITLAALVVWYRKKDLGGCG